ncbi:hypothetical protein [Streptomyces sp. bgisy154]|uniref:hypothetical protein n=1 Tax=Streptomyces sp. bgisy154 TaxID=3413794 RepID=UPI003D711062
MTTPGQYLFRLSPDARHLAIWQPGQEPWVVHPLPTPRTGHWVPACDMSQMGWTPFVPVPTARAAVLANVNDELARQDTQWGEQNHPDGTGPRTPAIVGTLCWAEEAAGRARLACQTAARKGKTTWRLVFAEEALEALAEDDPARLRAELIQVAAVAVNWAEAIDRRTAQQNGDTAR